MAFSCQTSRFTRITLGTVCITNFSGVLTLYLTVVLYTHLNRNSSYVRNNPDYSMFKTEIRIWLVHGPTLSEFLGHLEPEFDDSYLFRFDSPLSLF